MSSPTMPHTNTQFYLHIPAIASELQDPVPSVDHVLLTMDTLRAQLTLGRFPRVLTIPSERADATPDRSSQGRTSAFKPLSSTATFSSMARASIGRFNSDFYDGFTYGLLDIARAALGGCVRCDLALYVIDMRVLVPDPALDEAPLSFLRHYYPEPATPDFPNDDLSPDITIPSPASLSINVATELAEASADGSGYESFDTMPSLRTIADSDDDNDEYSDSSEEPNCDSEEEASIAQGFVVDESDADDSDVDL
ncbi:hypothetical protein LXA43DRAFT_1066829 [Ganoderma leucocontextum]|nr:hypothetical protein LXA43DRAFT_1066829 [Ganoderma leucocontextum]